MADNEEPDALLMALGDVAKVQQEQTTQAWQAANAEDDGAALAKITSIPLDVLRPLDDAEQEAVLEDVFGVPANVVQLPQRRRSTWIAASAATVLAAAAAVLLSMGPDPTGLPAYQVEPMTAGETGLRGPNVSPTGQVARFTEGSRINLTLRPSTAVQDRVQLQATLVAPDGDRTQVELMTEALGRGTLRVSAIVGQHVPNRPGNYRLELTLSTASGSKEPGPPLTFDYVVRLTNP